jgi:hypothetical protein
LAAGCTIIAIAESREQTIRCKSPPNRVVWQNAEFKIQNLAMKGCYQILISVPDSGLLYQFPSQPDPPFPVPYTLSGSLHLRGNRAVFSLARFHPPLKPVRRGMTRLGALSSRQQPAQIASPSNSQES